MNLADVRDYISSLEIAEDEHCYCGKMPDKKEKSIGVYPLKQRTPCSIPLGGINNSSYKVMSVSLLVHWNRSPAETERAANRLQDALLSCRERSMNGETIKFILVSYDEPVPVDTDDEGIHEYVTECLIYYERNR